MKGVLRVFGVWVAASAVLAGRTASAGEASASAAVVKVYVAALDRDLVGAVAPRHDGVADGLGRSRRPGAGADRGPRRGGRDLRPAAAQRWGAQGHGPGALRLARGRPRPAARGRPGLLRGRRAARAGHAAHGAGRRGGVRLPERRRDAVDHARRRRPRRDLEVRAQRRAAAFVPDGRGHRPRQQRRTGRGRRAHRGRRDAGLQGQRHRLRRAGSRHPPVPRGRRGRTARRRPGARGGGPEPGEPRAQGERRRAGGGDGRRRAAGVRRRRGRPPARRATCCWLSAGKPIGDDGSVELRPGERTALGARDRLPPARRERRGPVPARRRRARGAAEARSGPAARARSSRASSTAAPTTSSTAASPSSP